MGCYCVLFSTIPYSNRSSRNPLGIQSVSASFLQRREQESPGETSVSTPPPDFSARVNTQGVYPRHDPGNSLRNRANPRPPVSLSISSASLLESVLGAKAAKQCIRFRMWSTFAHLAVKGSEFSTSLQPSDTPLSSSAGVVLAESGIYARWDLPIGRRRRRANSR